MALPQSKYSATGTWNPVKVKDVSCDPTAKSSCNEKYEVEVDGISHDNMEYPISKLSPGTECSVQVSACTSAGPGKWSDPTTHESGMFLIQSVFISLVDCT